MRNKVTRKANYAIIHIKRRNGDNFEVKVDVEDLDKIQEINSWRILTGTYGCRYVCGHLSKKKNGYTLPTPALLHRWVMIAPANVQVGFLNKNTLDCRKQNLFFANSLTDIISKNQCNNETGEHHVWKKAGCHCFSVSLRYRGKVYYRGKFSSIEDAVEWRDKQLAIISADQKKRRELASKLSQIGDIVL